MQRRGDYIQSGHVVFDRSRAPVATGCGRIQRRNATRPLRGPGAGPFREEMRRVVDSLPFRDTDASSVHVAFLPTRRGRGARRLRRSAFAPEALVRDGGRLLFCRGDGTAKLPHALPPPPARCGGPQLRRSPRSKAWRSMLSAGRRLRPAGRCRRRGAWRTRRARRCWRRHRGGRRTRRPRVRRRPGRRRGGRRSSPSWWPPATRAGRPRSSGRRPWSHRAPCRRRRPSRPARTRRPWRRRSTPT